MLKGFRAYLDKQEQYWIIVHVADGATSKPEPYFIKKLQQGSQPYILLKLLIEARPYSEFPNLIPFPKNKIISELRESSRDSTITNGLISGYEPICNR